MPHVVLTGDLSVADIFESQDDLMYRDGGLILKTGTKYLAADSNSIAFEATVIEPGARPVNFFALVNRRDDGIVVRIHPTTDPEKTPGVKMLLAQMAKQIMSNYPQAVVGKTNLQEYLE